MYSGTRQLTRDRANAFIEQAIAQNGRVLVHCNGQNYSGTSFDESTSLILEYIGGISLSPAFVVMYVMQHMQLNWEDALHMVQNRRYCISPNGGFLTQIKVCMNTSAHLDHDSGISQEYESIYKAQNAVSAFPALQNGATVRRKRADEDDEEETLRCVEIPLLSCFHSHLSARVEDRKRALVDEEDEIDEDEMMMD